MLNSDHDILDIIRLVEKVHHPLEEQELFPAIAAHPLLRQGGPLCTYFRGIELELSPRDRMQEHLEEAYREGLPQATPYAEFSWLNPQNPLSMPMDEHVTGHNLAEAISFLAKSPDDPLYKKFYAVLCQDYKKLLRAHIDKEDNCLFVMCERILP